MKSLWTLLLTGIWAWAAAPTGTPITSYPLKTVLSTNDRALVVDMATTPASMKLAPMASISTLAGSVSSNYWTLAVIPDSQYYSNTVFSAMAQAIITNAARYNIQAVLSVGDVVDNGLSVSQ